MLKKRGISQQIATVLLVGFTIALLVLLFLWGQQFIKERAAKQGKIAEIELNCGEIDISIVNAYQQGSNAIIVLKNKRDMKINKFTFRLEGSDIEPKETLDKLNNLEVKQYTIPFEEDELKTLNRITVVPWLKVAFGYYLPCNKQRISTSL